MSLPLYMQYLVDGLLIFCLIASTAVIVLRTGRSPYWALVILVPYLLVPAIWALAFSDWPALSRKRK